MGKFKGAFGQARKCSARAVNPTLLSDSLLGSTAVQTTFLASPWEFFFQRFSSGVSGSKLFEFQRPGGFEPFFVHRIIKQWERDSKLFRADVLWLLKAFSPPRAFDQVIPDTRCRNFSCEISFNPSANFRSLRFLVKIDTFVRKKDFPPRSAYETW